MKPETKRERRYNYVREWDNNITEGGMTIETDLVGIRLILKGEENEKNYETLLSLV